MELCKEFLKKLTGRRYLEYRFLRLEKMIMSINQMNRNKWEISEWSDKWNYYKKLHDLLYVMDVESPDVEWCRLGSPNDGGYVMLRPREKSTVYSIGINRDVSWDKAMANMGCEIYMYDHTIDRIPEKNSHFHWKKKGIEGISSKDRRLMTLKEMVISNGHQDKENLILKMDVEGCEWSVLANTEKEILMCFEQIIMEIHGLCGNSEMNIYHVENSQILRALENLNITHQLVHVHANNYNQMVDYCGNLMMPSTMEVTFVARSKYSFSVNTRQFPTKLDGRCDLGLPDIFLGSWNLSD